MCKHWVRGICKKNEACDNAHVYNMARMQRCTFLRDTGSCNAGADCIFLHIMPVAAKRSCPAYDRGFCRRGPACQLEHVRRELCPRYLAGFCPGGRECTAAHPRFLPNFGILGEGGDADEPHDARAAGPGGAAVCGRCRRVGHLSHLCPGMNAGADGDDADGGGDGDGMGQIDPAALAQWG